MNTISYPKFLGIVAVLTISIVCALKFLMFLPGGDKVALFTSLYGIFWSTVFYDTASDSSKPHPHDSFIESPYFEMLLAVVSMGILVFLSGFAELASYVFSYNFSFFSNVWFGFLVTLFAMLSGYLMGYLTKNEARLSFF
jgi:hypothetical protein